LKANREKWLASEPGPDHYRIPAPIRMVNDVDDDRPITLILNEIAFQQQRSAG
jgi:pyrophosphate--fructose-6-phosphate 1-phosphotransferase